METHMIFFLKNHLQTLFIFPFPNLPFLSAPRYINPSFLGSILFVIKAYNLIYKTQDLQLHIESNVRIEKRRKPEPSCVVCEGSGRVDCYHCHGKGRINYTELSMLPKGEWPKWCKICGGSGLGHCTRCLGTGEYRDIMGFHFMKRESDHPPKHTVHQNEENAERLTAADLLLSQSLSESEK
ncbi:uncharacterized protein LOC130809728 isoform X2 [Amaranthus tricolor]|uniref:uncharacterized protein LOC130809728 isoform X2 n=1 Tax=Amaranthus tricolor TaxID=29722 RepID=UPI0025906607|nr:uncharacterized protein LOC130809728 isoform X2 [Amaranthus tricolor]